MFARRASSSEIPNPAEQAAGDIRIILFDDQALVRQALARAMSAIPGVRVLADSGNLDTVVELLGAHRPDLMLLDAGMARPLGPRRLADLCRGFADVHLVLLSERTSDASLVWAAGSGVAGCVAKDRTLDDVVATLRRIRWSTRAAPTDNADSKRVGRTRSRSRKDVGEAGARAVGSLTARQREVLRYLVDGLTRKQIAGILRVSTKTADNHVHRIMVALDAHNRVDLVRHAIREGLVSP